VQQLRFHFQLEQRPQKTRSQRRQKTRSRLEQRVINRLTDSLTTSTKDSLSTNIETHSKTRAKRSTDSRKISLTLSTKDSLSTSIVSLKVFSVGLSTDSHAHNFDNQRSEQRVLNILTQRFTHSKDSRRDSLTSKSEPKHSELLPAS
jgi:ATP-dependent protease HslVU (ClpYQ) ATPase subunit